MVVFVNEGRHVGLSFSGRRKTRMVLMYRKVLPGHLFVPFFVAVVAVAALEDQRLGLVALAGGSPIRMLYSWLI